MSSEQPLTPEPQLVRKATGFASSLHQKDPMPISHAFHSTLGALNFEDQILPAANIHEMAEGGISNAIFPSMTGINIESSRFLNNRESTLLKPQQYSANFDNLITEDLQESNRGYGGKNGSFAGIGEQKRTGVFISDGNDQNPGNTAVDKPLTTDNTNNFSQPLPPGINVEALILKPTPKFLCFNLDRYSTEAWMVAIYLLIFEAAIIFAYGFAVRFDYQDYTTLYPRYMDLNVMVFVGFGFLMTFLKEHSWSSIGLSFLLNTMSIQIQPLFFSLWQNVFSGYWDKASLNFRVLSIALWSSIAVMINFCAFLGFASIPQLFMNALMNQFFYALNFNLLYEVMHVEDDGGSIHVHLFGSCFAIGSSFAFLYGVVRDRWTNNHSTFETNVFAFIGTIFLWMFWPSAASLLVSDRQRDFYVMINIILSITSSTVITFCISPMLNNSRFRMENILNATLAGGIIIGASCSWIQNPAWSLGFGLIAGVVSSFAFKALAPWLQSLKLYNSIGVTSVHFLSGLLGGLFSGFICAIYYDLPTRSASAQGGIQVACVFITIGIGLAGGVLTGVFMRLLPRNKTDFHDKNYWIVDSAK